MKKDWTTEDITVSKVIGLIICMGILFAIGHYMDCEYKSGAKYTPRSCKVVISIVKFVYRMP